MHEPVESKNYIESTKSCSSFPAKCECKGLLEIKIRKFGGGKHYVWQCNQCGLQRGNSINRTEALRLLNGSKPRDFDPSIEEYRQQENKLVFTKNYPRVTDELTRKWDEAKVKLSSVVEEIGFKLNNEQLLTLLNDQVVTLGKKIIDQKRKNVERFNDEEELKAWFEERFSEYFFVYKDAKGIYQPTNKNVYIDYVLFPKPDLVNEGFESRHFGVEVKYFNQERNFTHKTSTGIRQTISYNDCSFYVDHRLVDLRFTLIFSNLSFDQELELVTNFGNAIRNDLGQWIALLQLAYYARVGSLSIIGDKRHFLGWEMLFARTSYFRCQIVNNQKIFRKSKHNLLDKDRIGNLETH